MIHKCKIYTHKKKKKMRKMRSLTIFLTSSPKSFKYSKSIGQVNCRTNFLLLRSKWEKGKRKTIPIPHIFSKFDLNNIACPPFSLSPFSSSLHPYCPRRGNISLRIASFVAAQPSTKLWPRGISIRSLTPLTGLIVRNGILIWLCSYICTISD